MTTCARPCNPAISGWLLAAVAVGCWPPAAWPDTVKLYGKPAFRRVEILDFHHGRLHFRGVSRQVLRKPLDQIEWLQLDSLPELAQAETPPDADWSAAAERYGPLIARTDKAWLTKLLRIRQAQAYDRAGEIDQAVQRYLRLRVERLAGSEAAIPRRPAPVGDARNAAARSRLQLARRSGRYRPFEDELLRLELELLLWDRIEPLPKPFSQWEEASSDPPGTTDEGAPPALFGDLPLESGDRPQLEADSPVFAAIDGALVRGEYDDALHRLRAARPFCKPESPLLRIRWAQLDLFEGRTEAALAGLLDLAGDESPEISVAARYYAGLAYAALEQLPAARREWRRLLIIRGAPEALKNAARRKLEETRE